MRPVAELGRCLARSPEGPRVLALARAVSAAGGRAYVVGGWVRDVLRGAGSGDLDLEVHGLPAEALRGVLAGLGAPIEVGRAFPVFRVKGLDVDVALPRGPGQTPSLEQAARRRDLRINALLFDPLDGTLHDPLAGLEDLERGRLRACDPERFGEDPLRGLRVASLAARLEMEPDRELEALCAALDLSAVAGERMVDELRKLLLAARRPSLGLACLERCGLLRWLPPLAALVGVPQDPRWHPEGDVWIHTRLSVDAARDLARGDPARDLLLLFGTLCHDLGKPETTRLEDGRVRSPGHAERGEAVTREWLSGLHAPGSLVTGTAALVRHHLAPAQLVDQGAGPAAYRRLARRLEAAGVDLRLLEGVARADHLGRTTEDARRRRFEQGDRFLARADEAGVARRAEAPVVQGRHLVERGLAPGPRFGRILEACRAVQDETGLSDPGRILDRVLGAAEPEAEGEPG